MSVSYQKLKLNALLSREVRNVPPLATSKLTYSQSWQTAKIIAHVIAQFLRLSLLRGTVNVYTHVECFHIYVKREKYCSFSFFLPLFHVGGGGGGVRQGL